VRGLCADADVASQRRTVTKASRAGSSCGVEARQPGPATKTRQVSTVAAEAMNRGTTI
jgi:hypothetical protein